MNPFKLSLLCAALIPSLASAQRDLKDIPDPNADLERASFQMAPGLEATLWASDPMIAKPIQMAWDARGRLWVASSAIYPQVKPGATADDKIVILEDTDGDGKADKSTVFYDGLLIPTGVWPVIDSSLPASAPGRYNAAYVANSTEVLLMRDTDGDGRADDKQIVMSGFGTEDTHHILHGFKGAPDGSLYVMQSVYIHTHMETPYGTRRLLGSGIWQFRPETGQAEIFTWGQVNPWGHIWDRWGQSFTTDGAYGEGINFAWPGATFLCLPNQRPRILKGMNPGQPKQVGLEIVNGRAFPDDWQGTVITNDFRGHRVNRFALRDEGSGYVSKQTEDVVTTTHGAFRPVDVRSGPDGAIYLADWYNPIIQHGEVDFRDERRDHVHGRIWRLSMKGRPVAKTPDYAKLSEDQLLDLLREPEDQTRYWAKQELKSRPADKAKTALTARVAQPPQGVAATLERTEQMWAALTLHTTPELAEKIAAQLLASEDAHARAAGVRYVRNKVLAEVGLADALEKPHAPSDFDTQALAKAIGDANPRVRLEAINALRTMRTPKSVELAMTALRQPVDDNLDYALWLTAWELADLWVPALQAGTITFDADPALLSFVLKAASHKPEAAGALVKLIRENKIPAEKISPLLQLIAEAGTPEDLALLVEMAVDQAKMPEAQRVSVFAALTNAAKQRNVRPGGELNRVEALLGSGSPALKAAVARLAGAWKLESSKETLQKLAEDQATETSLRQAAMEGLSSMGSADFLLKLVKTGGNLAIQAPALALLASQAPDKAAPESPAILTALEKDPAQAGIIIDSFLKSTAGPAALTAALQDKQLPMNIAMAGLQKASSVGGDTAALQAAFTKAGKLEPMVQQLTPEQMSALMAEVKTSGDPRQGELIYRRAAMQCSVCHSIGAAGGIIGPNLVSLGSSAPVDYIVESLLEPSKKIKEGYATTVVTLKNNEILTGFLSAQSEKDITLRDAAGKLTQIARDTVAKVESVPVSLMPPGLTASLRRDEFIHLVRFLSELGKEGEYKVAAANYVRRWRVLNFSESLNEPMNKDGWRALGRPNPDYQWTPAYSAVNGSLPGTDVPKLQVLWHKLSAVQTEITVTTAGKIGLQLDDATNVHLFLGEKEIGIEKNLATLDLPLGTHTLVLAWDHSTRAAPSLRVEVVDLAGSSGHASPVGGP